MLVITRFRPSVGTDIRPALEQALTLLAAQRGFVDGCVGRNVDDPSLWVLQTRWSGVGDYRRALSSYEVKVGMGQAFDDAVDEPGAYEVVRPGLPLDTLGP